VLQTNRLKQLLGEGKPVFGLLNSIPSPLVVEMVGYAGYDFVILDMEHVCVNPETLENMVRAAECSGMTPLVRVPDAEPDLILRVLDCGAQGIVVSNLRTRAEAERAVAASRFHPLGKRSISGGRQTGFGTIDLATYFERANREIMVVVMIEDREGVENLDEILSVDGIDMVIEGAMDLSHSFGLPGQAQHPSVQDAVHAVARACTRHRVQFCAIPRVPGQLEFWREQGVQAHLLGDDRGVSFRALKGHLAGMRGVCAGSEAMGDGAELAASR
jgi:4-hydroxy-2-oxoheptanedioate aldolase